jgi:hypothetical protein
VEMFSNDPRLADLHGWQPEGMRRIDAPPDASAHMDGTDTAALGVSPAAALAATRAAAARKQTLRSMGGRRRGRR